MSDFMTQIEQEVKADLELARLVSQEELIGNVTELILEKLENKGMTRSDLAKILETSKSHVTQLLQGSRNMTLRTVSDIFFNLGYRIMLNAVSDSSGHGVYSPTWRLCVDDTRSSSWKAQQDFCPFWQPPVPGTCLSGDPADCQVNWSVLLTATPATQP